jgi:hypothetical protein
MLKNMKNLCEYITVAIHQSIRVLPSKKECTNGKIKASREVRSEISFQK